MKARNVLLGLLLGAIVLFPACSSNSPTAPPPSPTPVAYSISLTASPAETLVNGGILLSARVTSGGKDVPDNTSVTFTISSCVPNQGTSPGFGENMLVMTCETTRTTTAGVATATIWSAADGTFEVVARVPGQTAKILVKWSQPIVPQTLAVYSVSPNRGRPEGGQQVTIYGKGFAKPLAVDFIVASDIGHAQVLSVNAAGTEIVAVTPPVAGTVTAEVVADVRVTAAFGTADQVSDTLQGGYTYERQFGEPRIYSLEPARGSYTGGEQVTIYGANLYPPIKVRFGAEEAQVLTVSADNARITVFTPRHPGSHLTEELVVDVTVVTRAETVQQQQATLADSYTYLPDSGVPQLYSVVPSRGNPRGGELVTLTGKNFTAPVLVEFIVGPPVNATLPATVVTPPNAEGTQMVVRTPQASPQPLATDALVDIRITNLVGNASSQNQTFTGVFTYNKEARELDVYSVRPNRGRATGGEEVTIYGRGFVQPVAVNFIAGGAALEAQVKSVSADGATAVVYSPAVPQEVVDELVADVQVVAAAGTTIEQRATLASAFTYERQFTTPRIYGVVPNRGSYDGGDEVTILGADFNTPLHVTFGAEAAEVVSSTATEVVVRTPRHDDQYITEELLVAVTVTTRYDTLAAQTVTKNEAYTYLPNTGVPALFNVVPSRGSPRGGTTVTITGQDFWPPVLVEFLIGPPLNTNLPATLVSVSADARTIVVQTPQATPDQLPEDTPASIRITNLVGTAISQTATFTNVFTYEREARDISIYSVDPNRGKAEGGDSVKIYGKGFVAPAQVDFIIGGVAHSASVVSVADGLIECVTPAVPESTNAEVTADVKVTAAFGLPTQKDATLAQAFTFLKQFEAPRIFQLEQEEGKIEGGQNVTIHGSGFVAPIRVTFYAGSFPDQCQTVCTIVGGAETCRQECTFKPLLEDVQATLIDEGHIAIVTPRHPGQITTQDVNVDVAVYTRWQTAQEQKAELNLGFTYLADFTEPGTPVVYSITPDKGPRIGGQEVVIRGENLCGTNLGKTEGFRCVAAPAVVFALGAPLSGTLTAEVTSFSADGRSIVIRTPQASNAEINVDVKATVTVANVTGAAAVTDGYTYLADVTDPKTPVVYSITPDRGPRVGGQEVVIRGENLCGKNAGPADDFECLAAPAVTFTLGQPLSGTLAAEVTSFSADGRSIVIRTPQASTAEIQVDVKASVTVTNVTGEAAVTDGYTYVADYVDPGIPAIFTITPDKGSRLGGEQVEIVGQNLCNLRAGQAGGWECVEPPVVTFALGAPVSATFNAEVVANSWQPDGKKITVITPQAAIAPLAADVLASVKVANGNGADQVDGGFTYLADVTNPGVPTIFSINPDRGSRLGGEEIVIRGTNLCGQRLGEAGSFTCSTPPTVTFAIGAPVDATVAAEVVAGSWLPDGQQIRVRTPQASNSPLLADVKATVTVANQDGSAQVVEGFIYLRDETPLAIYSVVPSRGRPEGGQEVVIYGRGFVGPIVNVDFITAAGGTRAAEVIYPLAAAGNEIRVKTPATGVDASIEHVAAIKVTVAVGTANQNDVTLDGAFTYEKRYAAPLIYSVVPNRGSWKGGTTLQIIGANFLPPLRVTLGGEDAEVLGSSTASVLQVKTPLHPDTHLTEELPVDVTVFTSFETLQQQQATLAAGFTWIPDTGVPLLYSVVPNKGDPRGVGNVVLTGKNFTEPVTVEFLLGAPFGTTLPATVISVNADGTQMTVRIPQASPTPVTSEVVCGIRITNLVGSALTQTATFAGVFTYDSETNLAIYSVTPNRGRAEGLDTVQILGRGFIFPVNVDFVVGGQVRHAEVLELVSENEILVLTPATGLDSAIERIADIVVTAAAGTANQISDTLPASFTYEKFFGAPAIYGVNPDRGSWAGNEVVQIIGSNFFAPLRVYFGDEEATVDDGASTANTLVVRTPRHVESHLTEDKIVDVRVQTRFDSAQQQEVTLPGAFTWKPDTGVPLLYGVVPSKGDRRGGETVTLTGRNFTAPVTVEFVIGPPVNATYPATLAEPINADGTVMKVITPQASPSPLTQEAETDIRITNLVGSPSSQTATYLRAFTYKTDSELAIYTVNPNRGSPRGAQEVLIHGRGFVAPVNVHFLVGGAERQAEVLDVLDAGATVKIKTPASNVDATVEHVADVRVTVAAGTAGERSVTLPASYTYEKEFAAPAIYSVQPNRGSHAGGETIKILGSGFFPPVRVLLGGEIAEVLTGISSESVLNVTTPVHVPSHLTQDLTVDVVVLTRYETAQQQQVALTGGFTWIPDTGVPILYSVVPARGSPRGNEDVELNGRNFTTPVTVDFILGAPLNTTLPATVVDVITNADGTQTIKVKTPTASPTPVTTDVVTAIRITNQVGSPSSQTATFSGVFTYEGEARPPIIYFVDPDQGSPRGGETVTIYGRFFLPQVRVQFSFTANGVAKTVDAEVVSLSADGTEITVITPTASIEPLEANAPVTVQVTSEYGTGRDLFATLDEGFLYLAEHPTPELFSLTPNSGPIEGGTRITITGTGFQYPVQVFFTIPVFGAIQAQVATVNFSRVVVIAPSITPMEPDTPTIAQVSVINMETGKISNELTYRYGNAMFISAIAPTEGPDLGGTQVTIFGQGFVAPLTVELAGVPAAILTVSGTEIVVRSNAPSERECAPITGPVTVTNIDSNLSVTGPSYTYRPARPLITRVEVSSPLTTPAGSNIVQEYDPTRMSPCDTNDEYTDYTVVVYGENFEQYPNSTASAMSVIFTNPSVEILTTWVSPTEVRFTLPDLSAVVLDKAPCVINGAPGLRDIPTGLPFTIKNNNNACTDELDPAIIINPCDPNCKAGIIQLTLTPATLNLAIGTTATMTACISAVQTADTLVAIQTSGSTGIVDYSNDGVTFADTLTVTIPATQVCDTFIVRALTGGTVGVVGSLDVTLGGSTDTSQVTVGSLGIQLTPATLNLNPGVSGNLTIQLSAQAPAGGAAVLIAQAGPVGKIDFTPVTGTCANPSAPPPTVACSALGAVTSFTVIIPAGSQTYTFPVNGLNASPPGPVTVSATLDPALGGAVASSSVIVGQYQITLSPTTLTIPVGGTGTFTVALDAPAYAFNVLLDGIPVTITQTGPGGVITFDADADGDGTLEAGETDVITGQVVIRTGTQVATFVVNGVSGGGPVTVTVSLPAGVGGATASASVTVTTYIVTLTPETMLLPLGTTGNFLVTLSAPAPNPDGARIYLTQVGQVGIVELLKDDDTQLDNDVTFGDYVLVPAGALSAAFHVHALQEGGPIVVTATLDPALGTSSDSSTVSVGTLSLSAAPSPLTIPRQGSNTFLLTLSKAQIQAVDVTLTSSNDAVAFAWDGTYPAAPLATPVTIDAGSLTSEPILVYGRNLGPATIYARLDPSLGGATAQIQVNVTQAIQFVPQSLTLPVGSQGTFTLQVATAQRLETTITLDYSGAFGAVSGPPSVVLEDNTTTIQFQVWGMKPSVNPVSIVATLPASLPTGLAGASATGTITMTGAPYALTFNPASVTLPAGSATNVAASFNYPLPPDWAMPAGFYPYTMALAMSGPSGVIAINGSSATTDDTVTWDAGEQQVATDPFIVNAVNNGGPVTITGVGVSQIGSPTGIASVTVGPATTTLTMDPSPFMWILGQPNPAISVFISPVQGSVTYVQLQSSNPAVVQVPSIVQIPANTASASFTPTTVSTGTATITASITPVPAPGEVGAAAAALATTDAVTVFTVTRSPADLTILAGHTGTVTLTLSNPLPVSLPGVTAGGGAITNGLVSVPTPITIPAGVTSYDITVTALQPSATTRNLWFQMPTTVSDVPGLQLTATAITVNPLEFDLAIASPTVYVGSSTTATVTTASPVTSETVVTLSQAGPGSVTIPATVTIPAGSSTATFTVTGLTLGNAPLTLSAALPASLSAATETAQVTVADLPLTFAAPSAVVYYGGALPVTASIPAVLDADAVFAVTETGAGDPVYPTPVTIPAGSTSVVFDVTAGGSTGAVQLRGTLPAALNASAAPHATLNLTVANQALTFDPSPVTMAPNSSAVVTATILDAPLVDALVPLVNNDPGMFTIPPSITFPAGATSTTFTVTSLTVTGSGDFDATLPAALDPSATVVTTTVDIGALDIVLSPPYIEGLMAGSAQLFTLTIDAPVADDISVMLASDVPNTVSVPASVVIPAGQTTVTFQAIAESVLGDPAEITATLPSQFGGGSDTATIDEVIPLTIAVTPSTIDLASQTERTITVTTGAIMAKELILPISSLNPVMAGIFDLGGAATGSVVIPVGGSSASFRIRGLAQGFTGVDINVPLIYGGVFADPEATVVVRVTQLQLLFIPAALTIDHGDTTLAGIVLRDLSGDPVEAAVPLTVNLTTNNPGIVKLFSTQTLIPQGSSGTLALFGGNSPGGPAIVTATLDPVVGGATATLAVGVEPVDPPEIDSITPSSGPTAGGTNVTIVGSYFWSTMTVTFDGVPATNVVQVDPYTLTCTTPPHAAGQVDVYVQTPFGIGTTATDAFTYVEPGTATIVLSPNPLVRYATSTLTDTMTVGISPVQPSDTVVTLTSSNPIVASPPISVTIPGGSATFDFDPFGGSPSDGTATITAQLPAALGSGSATANVTLFSLSLSPSTANVAVGGVTNVALTSSTSMPLPMNIGLAAVAGTGSVSVPSSVTLPAGSTVNIPVTGLTAGNATVDITLPAAAGTPSPALSLGVWVAAPTWTVSPTTISIPIGGSANATVTLGAAMPTDTTFTLSAGVTNFTYPAQAVVPAGQLSATFPVTAVQLGGASNLTVTAPAGFSPASATVAVTVTDLTLTITPSTVGPLMAGGGHTFVLTVNQAQAAPFDIALWTNATLEVSVPASVQMPAGATATTFQAIAESTGGGLTIYGKLPSALNNDPVSYHATAVVTGVVALTVAATPSNVNIAPGTYQTVTVTIGVTAAKDVTLALSTYWPEKIGLFDASGNPTGSLVIPAGSSTGTFRIQGNVSGDGPTEGLDVWIDAPTELGGAAGTHEFTINVTILALQLVLRETSSDDTYWDVNHGATTGATELEAVITDAAGAEVPVGLPVTVRITSADPSMVRLLAPGGVAPGAATVDVVIPAWASSENFRVFGNSPGGPVAINGQFLTPVGNNTGTMHIGVADVTGAWNVAATPMNGPIAGGTTVTLTSGTAHAFWSDAQVLFGTTPATVVSQTPTQLVVTAPAHAAGGVTIYVTNPREPVTVNVGGTFTYYAPLSVAAVAAPSPTDNATPVTFTATPTGGLAPISYAWTFGDGGTGTGATPSHTYATAGAYTATVTATDSAGQTATATVAVTVNTAPPTVNITGPATLAVGTAGAFATTVTYGQAPFTYAWDFGDLTTGTGSAVSHAYLAAGTYVITVTVTDALTRVAVDTHTVTVTATITLQVTQNWGFGPTVTLNDGTNNCVAVNPGTLYTCGPYTRTTPTLTMSVLVAGGPPQQFRWFGTCATYCAPNTSPCILPLTVPAATCQVVSP